MTFWHRAIAIILLMVFTPASVLAGTPLRFCVGDDNHRAIEFVLSAAHHDHAGNAAEAGSVLGGGSDDGMYWSDRAECSDSPLLTLAQQPSRTSQATLLLSFDDLPAVVSPAPLAVASVLVEVSDAIARPFSSVISDSQLDALRTVVLLI